MEGILVIAVILAATVALGWAIQKLEGKNRTKLTKEQIEVLEDIAHRMRKHRKENDRQE